MNKLKSEIMVVGGKENEEHIEGIEIKEEIRYLGVWIDNKGTLKKTVMDRVQKSQRMRRYVNYLIAGRQRKLELGRIMWKGAVIPGIVFGLSATGGEKSRVEELDKDQRRFGRGILEVPKNAPKEFVNREMGWSKQKERIDFARLRVAKRMIDRNGKAKERIVKGRSLEARWIREVKENLRRYGIGEDEIKEL